MAALQVYGWIILGCVLFFSTFGLLGGLCIILYVLAFLAGGLSVVYYYGKQKSRLTFGKSKDFNLGEPNCGIPKIVKAVDNVLPVPKSDKRLTGSTQIDEQLQEVLEYTFRDYIQVWYQKLSDHEAFKYDIRQTIQKIVIAFSQRSKDVDLVPYLTTRMTNDFASHLRYFRKAQERVYVLRKEVAPIEPPKIENVFFDLLAEDMETKLEDSKPIRDKVCLEPDAERQYLQDLSEVLLYLLLPPEDFHNKPFRYLCREVCVNGMLIPMIELITDPDYINQYIAWMCKDGTFNPESFLTSIKASDNLDELSAVQEMIDKEIARQRAKDTGGSDDKEIKQQLGSLNYVKKMCQSRARRINGHFDSVDGMDEDDEDFDCSRSHTKLVALSLDFILNNNLGISYFIEFLTDMGVQNYLFFYLNVEGFKVSATQQLNVAKDMPTGENHTVIVESVREAAISIYGQYLSDKASTLKINMEDNILRRTALAIKTGPPSAHVFDEVQRKVFNKLHGDPKFYDAFRLSKYYVKLLSELDMLKDSDDNDSMAGELGETITSMGDDIAASPDLEHSQLVFDYYLHAMIEQTGIVKEEGKSYAVYLIRVTKVIAEGTENEAEEVWYTYRRYSDFHDLHMTIKERYEDLAGLSLPGKKILNNMEQGFLDKRQKELDSYLQTIANRAVLRNHVGLKDYVYTFLSPVPWDKGKSQIARKVDTLVNPLKVVGRNIGNVVKSTPDNFMDGLFKMSGGFKMFGENMAGGFSKLFRTGDRDEVDGIKSSEDDDNMALRIMLLIMDEVFDLRKKHQWLRRQVVALLQQIIKATFGDKINRKIIEYVELSTSAEQVAMYIKQFKESFWPEGILAAPRPIRDHNTKMRTRIVCKAKMLGSISDENLRHLIGSDTTRKGIIRVFEMFQHKNLNKRLFYVTLEGVLETLFPDNKFPEIFSKLHSNSGRMKKVAEKIQKQSKETSNTSLKQRKYKT